MGQPGVARFSIRIARPHPLTNNSTAVRFRRSVVWLFCCLPIALLATPVHRTFSALDQQSDEQAVVGEVPLFTAHVAVATAAGYIAATVLLLCFYIGTTVMFYRMRHAPTIKHRLLADTLMSAVAGAVLCCTYVAREAILDSFPCWIGLWFTYIALPLNYWVLFARWFMLTANFRLNEDAARRIGWQLQLPTDSGDGTATGIGSGTDSGSGGEDDLSTATGDVRSTEKVMLRLSKATLDANAHELRHLYHRQPVSPTSVNSSSGADSSSGHSIPPPVYTSISGALNGPAADATPQCPWQAAGESTSPSIPCTTSAIAAAPNSPPQPARGMAFYRAYRQLDTGRYRSISLVTYLVIIAIIIVVVQLNTEAYAFGVQAGASDHLGCTGTWELYPIYAMFIIFCLLLLPAVLVLGRGLYDTFGIRRECLIAFSCGVAAVTIHVSLLVARVHTYARYVPFLLGSYSVLMQAVCVAWPAFKAWRVRGRLHRIRQMDDASAFRTAFRAMFNDPVLFNEFKLFTLRDFSIENVLFIEACQVLLENMRQEMAVKLGLSSRMPFGGNNTLDINGVRRSLRSRTLSSLTAVTEGSMSSETGIPDNSNQNNSSGSYNDSRLCTSEASGEVRRCLQFIHDVFLASNSDMQVNLSYRIHDRLLTVIRMSGAAPSPPSSPAAFSGLAGPFRPLVGRRQPSSSRSRSATVTTATTSATGETCPSSPLMHHWSSQDGLTSAALAAANAADCDSDSGDSSHGSIQTRIARSGSNCCDHDRTAAAAAAAAASIKTEPQDTHADRQGHRRQSTISGRGTLADLPSRNSSIEMQVLLEESRAAVASPGGLSAPSAAALSSRVTVSSVATSRHLSSSLQEGTYATAATAADTQDITTVAATANRPVHSRPTSIGTDGMGSNSAVLSAATSSPPPPAEFNMLNAIGVLEEAREEVELLVVFDTYQRFLLARPVMVAMRRPSAT